MAMKQKRQQKNPKDNFWLLNHQWILFASVILTFQSEIHPPANNRKLFPSYHFAEAVEITPLKNKKESSNETSSSLLKDDLIEDGFFDPISPDPSCVEEGEDIKDQDGECWNPPTTSIEQEMVVIDATAMYGGDDPSDSFDEDDDDDIEVIDEEQEGESTITEGGDNDGDFGDGDTAPNKQKNGTKTKIIDKHWGSDENILKMRDQLRNVGKGSSSFDQKRPPIFLMPGLASTR